MNQNVLGPYGDFIESKFYFDKYKLIPSLLALDMPLDETKENIQKVFNSIVESNEIEILLERWKVSKHKNDKKSKDFINYYFIEIQEARVCIQVELVNENLSINYWYDRTMESSMELVQSNYRKIRELVGASLSPSFKVLARNSGEFYVEEINISNVNTSMEMNYNSDFPEINTIIQESLEQNKSGLILLHGKPGTGKTTYIKYLLSTHSDRNFIFIPNDFVNELLKPEFISFLLTQKNSILVIEDAEKVISSREKINRDSVVSTILQLTDGLFSDYLNIKVICTFNTNLKNIDEALLRKGRMIAFYEFQELSLEKTNELLQSIDQEESETEMTIAQIYFKQSKNYKADKKEIGFKNSL